MTTLLRTSPHFIRCIKPNAAKCANHFDACLVTRQLRYLGIQEVLPPRTCQRGCGGSAAGDQVVKIRQLGYPVRALLQHFWKRYKAFVSD